MNYKQYVLIGWKSTTVPLPHVSDHHYDKHSRKIFWMAYLYNIFALISIVLPCSVLIYAKVLWIVEFGFLITFLYLRNRLSQHAIPDK
ncbi:hypothetical protein [Philodulcilactobacillus myokoensis]|uniref:hypothetical protein n=1 Tax=Philodulcilactobacillus myokoensis TaxID=2929573 RepID=UPI00256FB9BB|nr:hypothetical protein [Philodulcilactobacillus myokoensis]